MRRLYLQIWLTLVAILVGFAVLASAAWWVLQPERQDVRTLDGIGHLLGDVLPGDEAPPEDTRAAVQRLAEQLDVDVVLHAPDGTLIARAGDPLPAPRGGLPHTSGWVRGRGGPAAAIALPDGRVLIARPHDHRHRAGWIAALLLLGGLTGLGAYPLMRRLTGRLERLRERVEQLGAGDLAARVNVEGRDEVADLARSFNRAASRIETLVATQRTMLASASHELRTPLARIRVALELLAEDSRPELRERVERDIGELDDLIGELLLASRLDVMERPEQSQPVDLLALAAEEAARVEARVEGDPVVLRGDPRTLRRLIRNLLENARRHANGGPTEVRVQAAEAGAVLRVLDRGPGVPEAERERIFEPFYRPAGMRETGDGGVGLGLALVRRIARHHGGDAHCLPREGGGTCFEVRLRDAT